MDKTNNLVLCADEVCITRAMTLEDIERVHVLETLCFSTPWSKESFEQEILTNQLARYVVLECGGEIAAYGGFWVIVDEAHITNIAVNPELRRKGLGKCLVQAMIETMREMNIFSVTLEVRDSNVAARKLYEGFGFKNAGVRPNYYQDPKEDAIIMWVELD